MNREGKRQQEDVDLTRIPWDVAFETGHPGIDTEHRRLVRLLGDLYELSQDGSNPARILAILTELQRYTVYHFGHESELMTQFGVAEIHCSAHRMAHGLFVSRINEAIRDAAEDPSAISHDLLRFLGQWLLTHIMGMDRDLVHEINLARLPTGNTR